MFFEQMVSGWAAAGARKFYEISQTVYKVTFWPSLRRHKQNYGWQMHFINQTHLQFSSSPRIVPASSQIITNPRNLKIVAWLEWRNEIHLRYSCKWMLCWKDPPWRGLEPRPGKKQPLNIFDRQIPIFSIVQVWSPAIPRCLKIWIW